MSSGRDEMMSRWSDEAKQEELEQKLMEISMNVDDFLAVQANQNELSIGALNGIVLARLMRLNMEVGNEDDFIRTLDYISKEHQSIAEERTVQ